ncbi:MAG: hypothetical protein V4696_04175 [Pseudomonadota bacterium]
MSRLVMLLPALMLGACGSDPMPTPPTREVLPSNVATAPPAPPVPTARSTVAAAEAPVLAVDGEGLRWFNPTNGAARPLPFGTARAMVMTALSGRGSADIGIQSECGAGPLDYAAWPDGLTLYFQKDRFTGWALDGRAAGKVTTAAGVGPGSSRNELEAAYTAKITQSTLGTEFTAGGLSGLLDGPGASASINSMWAGTSCNFR